MAGFDVDAAMQVLYRRLESMGFVVSSSQPDEWERPARPGESGYQVRLLHVSGTCEVRHRRTPVPLRSGAITRDLAADRSHPWNEIRIAHGDNLQKFVGSLQCAAGTIEQHVLGHALVSRAPGE